MADNVTLPLTGTGDATAAVATDDVGGSHYQRVKIDLGGDGAASPLVRGQQSAANSIPVTLASDQGAVTISDGGSSITVDGAGTNSAFGAATPANGTAAGYSDGTNMQLARVFDLHTGGSTEYVLGVNLRFGAGSGSLEAGTSSNPLRVNPVGPATPSQSSVAGSATSVSLLASNASRKGATIFNDSTATLYIKLGATASTSSFTFKALQDDYYEVPFGYTGAVDGIWSSATGNARITELT